jgi:hypothetical protein
MLETLAPTKTTSYVFKSLMTLSSAEEAEFTFFNRLRCSKRARPSMRPSEVSSSGIVVFVGWQFLRQVHVPGRPKPVSAHKRLSATPFQLNDNSCNDLLSPPREATTGSERSLIKSGLRTSALTQSYPIYPFRARAGVDRPLFH